MSEVTYSAMKKRIAELQAALEKKGCARDQTTTQYCADVVDRDKRIAELEAALKDMARYVWHGHWDRLKPETRALLPGGKDE